MAQSYLIALTVITLLTVIVVSRWGEPSSRLAVVTEANIMSQAMVLYARARCLADNDSSGSSLTEQVLTPPNSVSVVELINQYYLSLEQLGFSGQTLPLDDTPENQISPNTGIRWTFIGWSNASALIEAQSDEPSTLASLRLIYPNSSPLGGDRLRLVLSPVTASHTAAFYSHSAAELMYETSFAPTTSSVTYSDEKRSCFL